MDILTTFGHPPFVYYIFTETLIPFSECYWIQFLPCSGMNITTALMFSIGLDRYFSLKYPMKYRSWPPGRYLCLQLLGCLAYDALVKVIGYFTLSDDPVICLIADAYYGYGKDFWVFSEVFINILVMIVYLRVRKEMKNVSASVMKTQTENIMSSLYMIVFFYFFGWLTTMCLLGTLRVLTTEANLVVTAELGCGFFANMNMTIPAFIYFRKSVLYKNALKELFKKPQVGVVTVSASAVTSSRRL
uniref:G_PROTEIN_RECEP_F1_2 domain-containing protein n=1 Tax=Steinernema glaseri TaxID=37863 RepID=A0A1I7Y9V6_9BILA